MTLADTVDWLVQTGRRRVRRTEWLGLGALGIIAFVAGYVATGALTFVGTPPTDGVGIVGALITIGFAFYAGHTLVPVSTSGQQFEILSAGGNEVPIAAYYAVPILVLFGVGLYVRWEFGRPGFDPLGSLLNVIGVGVGYVLMAAVGTFVFVTSTNAGEAVAFPVDDAILVTSLYVFAFGVLGAALASIVDSWRRMR